MVPPFNLNFGPRPCLPRKVRFICLSLMKQSLMFLMLSGFRFGHSANAAGTNLVEAGSVTLVSAVQLRNASLPIVFTDDGMMMD